MGFKKQEFETPRPKTTVKLNLSRLKPINIMNHYFCKTRFGLKSNINHRRSLADIFL